MINPYAPSNNSTDRKRKRKPDKLFVGLAVIGFGFFALGIVGAFTFPALSTDNCFWTAIGFLLLAPVVRLRTMLLDHGNDTHRVEPPGDQ